MKSSAIRALVQALQKTRLTDKPGKDVENFGNKVDKMEHRISGKVSALIELSTLFATEFISWGVLEFQINATCLHNLVDSNPKDLYEGDIIRTLKTKLRSLKAQGLCRPAEIKKAETDGDLAVLNLAMNKLVEFQKSVQKGGNVQYQYAKSRDLSVITCFRYQKKENFQDNCTLSKKSGTSFGNKENPATSGYEPNTDWRYKRTKIGYPETKVVNDRLVPDFGSRFFPIFEQEKYYFLVTTIRTLSDENN